VACPAAAVADPPPVSITGGPAGPTNNPAPEFAFHTDDPLAVLTCRLDGPAGAPGTESPCTSPADLGPLAEGDYVFVVHATDPVDGIGEATRAFTVDTTAPDTAIDGGSADDHAAAFVLSASEAGATFECSLAGPGRDGSFAACDGAPAYTGLADGDYTFAARAVDAAGNVDATPATRAFSIVTPPPPQPPPTPTPAPLPLPLPPPVPRLHATVVVRPGLADVRVRPPGAAAFAPLTGDRALPVGTLIDARRGSVQLVTAPKLQHATFTGAVFRVTQPGRQTVLTLVPAGCRAVQLTGDGRGAFEVRGRYSTATVRAGRWTVRDSCAGTLTRALRGLAQVRDTARHRTFLLRAGRAYLARRAN
jgi:hypothetical protein